MKLNRMIYNAEISLRYFYTRNFIIDNYKFMDLTLAVPLSERDDFSLTERLFSNSELYFNGYKNLLKIAFGETESGLMFARKRYSYIYWATKAIHAVIIFAVYKLIVDYLL